MAAVRRTAFVVSLCLILGVALPAQAAGTGQISGSVVDAKTGAPVANARIEARSPSDDYHAVTGSNGQFSLPGVTVDTYSLSASAPGYGPFSLDGVTINLDETFHYTFRLVLTAKTIGRVIVRGRSITSAFQPDQTVDRTVVNAQGIDQLLGKSFNTNGVKLLSELPGVAIDKNGTPLIRGGTTFEGALEFEGIDYTEPNRSLTDRFENVGSNYLLNGVGSIEIIPGGGDATHGNTGTGLLALTAKRGTSPGFATFDYEQGTLGGGNPANQAGFEYGIATRNNRLSNYLTYIGEDQHFFYGPYGTDPAGLQADPISIDPDLQSLYTANQRSLYTTSVFNRSFQSSRDFLDNAVYKFDKDQRQQVQFFVQSQAVHQALDYGGFGLFSAVPQTIFAGQNYSNFSQSLTYLTGSFPGPPFASGSGLLAPTSTLTTFINRFAPAVIGSAPNARLQGPETIDSPFSAYKIEYDNTLDEFTNLQFRVYRTDDSASETLPSQGIYVPEQGGTRKGLATDITRVLSNKNTLQLGGKYDFAVPYGTRTNTVDYTGVFDGVYAPNPSPNGGPALNLGAYTHDILADFLQPQPVGVVITNPANGTEAIASGTPGCIGVAPPAPGVITAGTSSQEHCGYLYRFFPNGPPPLPAEVETPLAQQQSYGLYAQDTYAPNPRLHVLAGLRLDGYNFLLPSDAGNAPAVTGLLHQRLYEPKFGISYRLGARDAVRANFGRSLSIPLPTFIGTDISRASFAAFNNVPSYDSVTGKAATYCGPASFVTFQGQTQFLGNQTCSSYGDQLYWLLRDARFGAQERLATPLQGATFTNYDFTYSHEFPGGDAVKLTPFYRRGYNVVEYSQTLLGIDPTTGTQQLSPELESNLGVQSAAGVEFVATTPQRTAGLSATVTATYINQIGNDPPGNYLPTASAQLGELYHSPNIAPFQATFAGTYRTKWGLRVNPILTIRTGYPYGAGVYEALTINGKPYYIPYTNTLYQGFYSSLLANANVDPQYPGTVTNPGVVAYRGTESATAAPGSLTSQLTANVDLVVSIEPPPGRHGLTYGVDITNLFDRTTSVPFPNYAYDCTLVYTGLCTGSGLQSIADPTHGVARTANSISNPYLVFINQAPIAVRFFAQAHL